MKESVLITGGTIIRSSGEEKADVLIRSGIIQSIASELPATRYPLPADVIDATRLLIFPGLIDCHVHFREPGYPNKATMKTESLAALYGGVTTVCEMPNTDPPTVTIAALADKVRRASEITICDIRFFFGITESAHLEELRELFTSSSPDIRALRQRCSGVKLYLDHSTGNQKVEESLLDEIFQACAQLQIPVVGHCEDPKMNAAAAAANTRKDTAAHSVIRSPESEVASVAKAIGLARKYSTRFHIAHLSTHGALMLVRDAKNEGLPVTCEVAPHHLFLSTDDYILGTHGKMNPPLRSPDHVRSLWVGILDKTVDCISTDHAPHTREEKAHPEPLKAPSGVPGVETMLPLLLSVATTRNWPHPLYKTPHTCHLNHSDIVRLCFDNPNKIFSLGKPGIVEGAPADLALVDPSKEWEIRGEDLHAKCGWTPYEGWRVKGKVIRPPQ